MWILSKKNDVTNRTNMEFMCDNISDIDSIPKEEFTMGSIAIIINTQQMFIANSNKEWVEF